MKAASISGSAAYSWCRDWWAWHKIGININQWVSKWMYVPVVLILEWMWESPEACQNTDCWPDPQNSWVGRSGVRPPSLRFSQVTSAHGNCASQTTSPPGPASRVCLHLAGGSGMWSELHESVRCLWKWSQIWLLCSTRLQLTLRPCYLQNALPQAFLLLLFLLPDSTFNESGFSSSLSPMFNFSSLCTNLNCAIYLVGINIL